MKQKKQKLPSASTTGNVGLDLVYRPIPHQPESLIFAPRERASFVHEIWTAINLAKTWAQFSALLPPGEWEPIQREFEEAPEGSDEFAAEMLPGYCDGDYPPWLQAEADLCVPRLVREKFGQKRDSVINGPYWVFPSENEAPLVAALRGLGHSVEKKEDWIFH